MLTPMSRRQLLRGLSATAFSAVAKPLVSAAGSIHVGYMAITWGDAIEQAIDDIAALGYRGIQLRANAVTRFGSRPGELRDLLQKHGLTLVALGSGNVSIDPARERDVIAMCVESARFARSVNGLFLNVIDDRPTRAVTADDYRRLGRLMTEIGKRTTDVGVQLVYHHRMMGTGEKPQEIAAILDAADRQHVGLLLDVAHYQQGGGDPVKAVREYREWLRVVHLKDVRNVDTTRAASGPGREGASPQPYEWVELGRGRVDLPGVVAALNEIAYNGWAVIELDRVPDPGRTPKQSAQISKRYITERLKLTL